MKYFKYALSMFRNFRKDNPLLNSYIGRKITQYAVFIIHMYDEKKRGNLKEEYIADTGGFEIPDEDGLLLCPPESFSSSQSAVLDAERIFHQYRQQGSSELVNTKTYLQEIPLNGYLGQDSPLMNLALDPGVIGVVSKYLDTLPVLREIKMMYSPNEGGIEGGSQFFHVDKEYPRMMKMFLFVTSATEADGALTALPAAKSERVWKEIGMFRPIHRIADQQVFERYSKNDTRSIIGPKGSVGFLDVGRCLHFGSRPNAHSKPRLVVWFVYHSVLGNKFPFSLLGEQRSKFNEYKRNNLLVEPVKSIMN